MSFYDATREHFLTPEPALALLEAQAATGFLIDPVGKKRFSVAEATRQGLVGLELKEKLLSAERAATGFMDPYTEKKISLSQAIQKELLGKEQGARLLEVQIATGGLVDPATSRRIPMEVAYEQGYFSDEMSQLLSDPSSAAARGFLDPNTGERVPYLELQKRCIIDPATGLLLLPLKISFPGLRGRVSSSQLLSSSVIDMATFRGLQEGQVSVQEVAEMARVQQYLEGTGSIAGVAILPTNEKKSLYQALTEHLLMPGAALILLQAQAATDGLADPAKNRRLSVEDAVRAGVVGPELYEKLSSAERAATGYRDPCTGELLSLFQAMRKGLVSRDHGTSLLEAQMATGGIIDPVWNHRVPVEVACQRGFLDEEMKRLLSQPTSDIRGFFDPSSQEKLTYAELLERSVTDPDTGLRLLPLSGDDGEGAQGVRSFIDHKTRLALENTTVPVACGKFKGKSVSLWKLLFSEYFTSEQRATLTQQCLTTTLSMQELAKHVSTILQQMASTASVTFEGLRGKVSPSQLLSSEIISRDLFEKLKQGAMSAKEVVSMDMVRKYLEGTGSISGLLLPESQEKISIYQAKRKGLLMPGTSLILLEAQAATGFIIDPAANKKYSVEEALRASVIGPDVYNKLLAAEKAVTGYRDPYTGNKISLFQAMSKGHILRNHGIRLLEAQIATGGIIDPVHSHRVPVEVAYKRGYFDKKMNLILSDPSDDTKGFFDPNTQENLTYLQLKEKCIIDPSTGLCLLPLNSKKRQFADDATKQAFRSAWLLVKHGRFQGERVSVWDLLNSEYFSEGKRREIFNHYRLRKLTLEQIRLMLEEEMKKWAHIKFPAMRGSVTAYHLMETGIIDKALFERLLEGAVSAEEVLRMDSVRKYLYGSGSIGGIVLQPSNQKMSIYEAMKQKIVMPGMALPLLEAQAATGFIIDPVSNQKLCVDDAVREGVIGPEVHEKLQHAEGAVTGFKDPFTGGKVSLFQAMKKGLIADKEAIQLMKAQIATGGIIDPHRGHYVPVAFAQKQGYLDEDMSKTLSSSTDNTGAYCVPNSKETVTYAQLIERCQKDENSGCHLLPLPQTAVPVCTDEKIQQLFQETMVKEKGVSLWELIHSGYFTEEQRSDFVEKYRSEEVSIRQLVTLVLKLVKEVEMKAHTHVCFEGLRGSVPAVWLLDAGIITEKTFEELAQGIRTAREVAETESVKRYLQGTGSIAGIFIQASKKKMSIYQAMKNNLLLPGTGVLLLEAQAATGGIIDPVTNQKLGVEDAVKAAIVGEELLEKLLLAERAVTGYKDPYTGNSISVCQAIRKDLIPMSEGVPLLEAQLATGGVIDPLHHHHLPLPAAYTHGFYDEEMNQALALLNENTKVFFDPNTKENLTYQQLKDRCVPEAETGLWLLPLSETAAFYVDKQTREVLKSVTVCVTVGRFKGQMVSIWDLLNSEYITDRKQRELVERYKEENAEALQEITTIITTIIEETEKQGKRFTFKGLRKQVSASDLFQSQLIDKKTLDELKQGQKTVQDVTEMDSVRRYLEGGNFIAGVLVQPDNEKMSIYQAMARGMLRPGTALVLLEAQAATGFLLDPVKNERLSVEDAFAAGLIGGQIYNKLLSAEKAVTGYTDPYTKGKISLFEAMKKGLILKSHGIRLLEAQIATGGIIDPVHSHRVPVEVAYKRGYFDEEMNRILSDPSDDTKGFFDPNTHENLTYIQLLERCVQDPETGLYMLQIVKHGGRYFYIDESMKQFLRSKPIKMQIEKFKGQTVTLWDLLCSHYISEQKRKELVKQYKYETLTIDQLITIITTIVEEMEDKAQAIKVQGLREEVSASELFNSEIIDKPTLDKLQKGTLTVQKITKMDSVKRYLDGTGCIAGVLVPHKKEKMSVYQALKRGLLTPESALVLLEAQAATGFITDPLKNEKLSVDEATSAGLVGRELHEKLLSAERAVTGYTDPHTGNKISLFQAMNKNLVEKEQAIRLLEAQLTTGGIIDPVHSHRVPVEVAYKRGYLDDDTFLLLSDPEYGTKRFTDPNTHEKISYDQLLHRCIKDKDTGLYLFQIPEKKEDYFYIDEQTKNIMLSTIVQVPVGKYKGQNVSLWDLLCSEYISEEKKKELVKQYKTESTNILQKIIDAILTIIHEKERSRKDIWFQGIRQRITASELLNAQIITKDTLEKLEEGKQTAEDIAKMHSVKRYLEGTSCIAGVLVPSKTDPSKTEKMSIYQAMGKGILRPGTALVLLEAQAASGFITDPLKNEKLSVDEAVSAGLVGRELHEKLLSAERAVTGYKDPYTGNKISLFQAMKKDLIVKDHGIRLLEAQIATGGIIDPVHSHRVPVEVAYKRGYFDEEMNRILSDPSDDTKGFFDPNTHENLTYMQLLSRCVPDPDTGLYMLHLMHKGSVLFQLDEQTRISLQSAPATVSVGLFQGQNVTVWELLFSRYVPDHKRQELLKKYKAGTLTIQEMITIITTIITETEEKRSRETRPVKSPSRQRATSQKAEASHSQRDEKREQALKSTTVDVPVGEFQGRKASVWDLLFSKYVLEEKRQELLKSYEAGTLTVHEMITILTAVVTEAEGRSSKRPTTKKTPGKERTTSEEVKDAPSREGQQREKALKSTLVEVPAGEFHGRKVSVWDLLFSKYIPEEKRKELLELHRAGILSTDQMKTIVTTIVTKTEEESHHLPRHGESPGTETTTSGEAEPPHSPHDKHLENALRSETVDVPVGEFKGQEVSLWELLFSSYISENKRQELLKKYRAGTLTIQEMITIITTIIITVEGPCREERTSGGAASAPSPQDEQAEKTLRSATVDVSVGEFQGRKVSVWELLFSKYVAEEKRQELLQKYRAGSVTLEELVRFLTVIVQETEERSSKLKFSGLRRQVTASELFSSDIIDQNTLTELTQGTKTVQEITEMDSVKRYLEGTSCIAGVLVPSKTDPSKTEKMSIYQAMGKGILRPGTALVLLEAQAASGFITDPLKNEKLSVDEAVSAGLVGRELHEKLLSAERAVTGYKDPYTGNKISLFQAMKKDLIVKDHGIRLLEAQIATGGIIDPVHSHRVPVEVAYKRGYFDEEMNRILSDPSDDTKGFFDPNTHENLTYMQLLSRCVPDPDTGLYMLHLMHKGSVLFQLDEQTRISLQSAPATVSVGLFQGQNVTVWELLFSRYVPDHKRQELLKKYKAGTLTIQEMITIITTIITETEEKRSRETRPVKSPSRQRATSQKAEASHSQRDEKREKALKSTTVDVPVGEFQGRKASVWDLLFSKYVLEEKRQELLKSYEAGTLTVHEMITILTAVVTEAEGRSSKRPTTKKTPGKERTTSEEVKDAPSREGQQREKALKSTLVEVPAGEFHGRKVSVWDLLFSKYIPEEKRKELLELHRAGILSTDQMKTIVTTIVTKTEEESHHLPRHGESPGTETTTSGEAEPPHSPHDKHLENALRSETVDVPVGEFKGQEVSLWELLFSSYISENKRQELLKKYRAGTLTIQEMITIITTIIITVEGPCREERTSGGAASAPSPQDEQAEKTLRSATVDVSVGEFQGRKVSVWELLFSKYVAEEKRQELLQKYRAGSLTLEELVRFLTVIVQETEERSSKLKFSGLRRQVTASELFSSDIIDQNTLTELTQGTKTVQEITEMDSVKRYLEGTSCIAGVLVPSKTDPSKTEKMSIYQAMGKGILRPGTALVLLEAQAASGFITDPLKNEKLSVDEAVSAGLVGRELHEKLLSAERAVTGYKDPYTGNKISLFQAMKKDLIVKDHGIRLLEAQIATGGIIDPVHSHRVPVEVAYKRGYFDEEMNRILSDPSDDTKGFFDPNTHENLTYMQLLSRCVPDPDTGLYMLHLMHKGSVLFQLDEQTRISLQSAPATVSVGLFQGQNVTVWELLFSRYVPDHKRQELLKKYKAGTLTIQEMITIITTIITETEEKRSRETRPVKSPSRQRATSQKAEASHSQRDEKREKALKSTTVDVPVGEFQGRKASVWDLLFSKYVLEEKRQELLKSYEAGTLTVHEMITILTAVVTEAEGRSSKRPTTKKTPGKERTTSEEVKDAPSREEQQREKALKSTLVEVPAGEFHGRKISVWDLLFSKYIPEEKRKELLELHRAGILSTDQMKTIVTTIVTKTEEESHHLPRHGESPGTETTTSGEAEPPHSPHDKHLENALRSETVDVPVGEFKGQEVSLWELLFSSYISENKRQELLKKYRAGTLTIQEMITIITTIIITVEGPCREERTSGGAASAPSPQDEQAEKTLRSATVDVSVGEFQGRKVSVWELLFSKYVAEEKRQELLQKYRAGSVTLEELVRFLTVIVQETEERSSKLKFSGLRRQVTASELFSSDIIDQNTLTELTQGTKTVQEITEMDSVKRYLEGTSCIAGVLVPSKTDPSKTEKMSIYQAMGKGILRPGTALVLLEAQAASGFITDPLKNEKLSVDEAVSAGLVGRELHEKLLSAERAVTGYKDPYTGNKISLFQAMKKDLIVKDHGIRLLEAQIATGGIIDPVHSHRVPVEVAYKRGYFDEEMNRILSDPSDDTKGFFDPNTHENLTYMQLLSRCVPDPDTGLYMLHLMHKGSVLFQLDEQTRISLHSAPATVSVGLFQGQNVTVWELLFSRYVPDHKRQELLKKYKAGTLTIQEMITIITTIITETEEKRSRETRPVKSPSRQRATSQKAEASHSQRDEKREQALKSTTVDVPVGEFQGRKASVWDLLFSKYVLEEKRQELLKSYEAGTLTVHEMITILTAVVTEAEGRSSKRPTTKKTPGKERTTSEEVKDAPSREEQQREKALKSTLVEVPAGEFHGRKVSVWDLLFSKYIPEEKRKELLELHRAGILSTDQMKTIVTTIVTKTEEESHHLPRHGESPGTETTTSGEAEPPHSPHDKHLENALRSETVDVPVGEFKGQEVSLWELLFSSYISENKRQELLKKYRAGTLTIQEMITIITTIIITVEGPCREERTSGGAASAPSPQDEQAEKTLRSATVDVSVGEFQGRKVSVWELLFSKYVAEEKRQELLQKYRAGSVTLEELVRFLTVIVQETEERSSKLKFSGLRRQVTASELFSSDIIDQNTLTELTQGTKTVQEITEMDSVKRYLEGTSCIAGVLVPSKTDPSKTEKMSIYQAMGKGILRPGTALVLLEAQAASGFITDPLKNEKLSVDEAVSAGLVGRELHEKLLSAERAVTGYKDPYTGNKISLFQAMKKDLIVKDHGIRLLEAQIATGGIIDPVHSHRVPVEVAYKRGYFDEEMNRILSDPSDDTKGFFDPNTHENLTYMQLLSRCVPDPDTGLYMLHLMHKGSVLFQLDEQTRISLQSAPATVSVGLFQGQNVTVWELLFSRYVPDHKRQELLKKYKAGTLTIQEMITIITTIITETEEKRSRETRPVKSPSRQRATSQKAEASHSQRDEKREKALKSTTVDVPVGEFQGRKASVWDLLFSKYVLEEKRQELLKSYEAGTLTVHEMITILTAVVTEAEGRSSKRPTTKKTPGKERTTSEEVKDAPSREEQQREKALKSTLVEVPAGEFHGRKVSVWDLLFSKYIPEEKRKELLELHRAGILSTDQMKTIVTTIVTKTEEESHHLPRHGESPGTETTTSGEAEPPHSPHDKHLENALRSETVDVPVGEFKGQEVSLWELLFSSYISENKRQELLKKYRAGTLTIQEMITIITTIIITVEGPCREERTSGGAASAPSPQDEQAEKTLRSATVDVSVGEFQGRKVSVWELLFSKYVAEEKRQELLQKYRAGSVTLEELVRFLTVIVQETEERSSKLKFSGLRRQVTASELFSSDIIDQNTLTELTQGTKTVQEITEMDSVKRYLEGTSCIAGVLVPSKTDPSKTEKMSIYQAMGKGILRPGTALVLLEAQAASGFITDPLKNEKLSVDEAVSAGLVGRELHEKLLSAERAVTGYKDPYTGNKISLFQAMKKDLIVKDHGIRLLEAQIATGGIIDPVHSHRVPVEVAYKRGYFDEEMNRILSDPSDDTKGFFDPNTHENLTYMQLLSRCVPDPDTGLCLLKVGMD
ncbi:epiplakin [Emydura macquarii macquarii]|uniref:epiplakin n=1 Tax=Emydura macquarii macquarii TaxID=1129001 RepID=UPI00352B665C